MSSWVKLLYKVTFMKFLRIFNTIGHRFSVDWLSPHNIYVRDTQIDSISANDLLSN